MRRAAMACQFCGKEPTSFPNQPGGYFGGWAISCPDKDNRVTFFSLRELPFEQIESAIDKWNNQQEEIRVAKLFPGKVPLK